MSGEGLCDHERALVHGPTVGELVGALKQALGVFWCVLRGGLEHVDGLRPGLGLLEGVDTQVEDAGLPASGFALQRSQAGGRRRRIAVFEFTLGLEDL